MVLAIIWLMPVGFFGMRTAGDRNYVWLHYYRNNVPQTKFVEDAPRLAVTIYDCGELVTSGITNIADAEFGYKSSVLIGAFVLWALPVAALYLLGLSIAWVRAGFKKQDENWQRDRNARTRWRLR
jgi:hypothetical protein